MSLLELLAFTPATQCLDYSYLPYYIQIHHLLARARTLQSTNFIPPTLLIVLPDLSLLPPPTLLHHASIKAPEATARKSTRVHQQSADRAYSNDNS